MTHTPLKLGLTALCVTSLCLLAAPTSAATIQWNLVSGSCTTSGSSDGNTRTCPGSIAGAPTVTASAWANTQGSTNVNIENALLETFSGGLGVRNRDRASLSAGDYGENSTPEHAVDNDGRYDSILFTFSQLIPLTDITIGYKDTDSDITVLAYTGVGAPPLAGNGYASLTGLGWTLVGHYANLVVNTPYDINPLSVSSRYWLVGAFNPLVGGDPGWTRGNDHFKIKAIGDDLVTTVPEPTSLLLLASGLSALGARRRQARRQD